MEVDTLENLNLQKKHILNWTYLDITGSDYFDAVTKLQIIEQLEDYQNLHNDQYWRNKMNDKEREMRSHPNRSHKWIPHRLEKRRDELRRVLMDYILGPEGYTGSSKGTYANCYSCNSNYETSQKAQDYFKSCLNDHFGGSAFGTHHSAANYAIGKEKCIQKTISKYGEETTNRISLDIFSQGRIPSRVSRVYGLCSICYKDTQDKMKELIDNL